MGDPSPKLGKIFIGGLSYETTDEKLRMYFSAFGPVTDAVVMKDPISRRSRGFGFITYVDPVCVDRALAQPNHILDSRRVEAKRAVPRAESTSRDSISSTSSSRNGSIISTASVGSLCGPTKKIFVGGLHYETKDAEFRRYFQQYGKVISAEVMFNRETNKSRGFGFVIFESERSVDLVLEENNHVIDGKSVEVKRAVPRTDVPPSRSVSSRANSFSGTTGPGSVGSLDDVSVTSTASISRSGTPSNSMSASLVGVNDSRFFGQMAQAATGPLSGYAAAVRYGGRGMPRHQPSPLHGVSRYDNPEKTLERVADRLTSLVLEEDVTTPLSSGSSRSSDKIRESPVAPLLSPLGITPRPLVSDPVIDQWNLSPSMAPHQRHQQQQQQAHQVPQMSPRDAHSAPWHARPWQKGWASQAEREDGAFRDAAHSNHHDPDATPSYFSAFAGEDRRGSSSSIGQTSWSQTSYAPRNDQFHGHGSGTMKMGGDHPLQGDHGSGLGGGSSMFQGHGHGHSHGYSHGHSHGHGSNGAFGRQATTAGLGPRSPYGTLGGFLQQPQFLPSAEPDLPLETALGGVMDDLYDDKLAMPTHFEQQYT